MLKITDTIGGMKNRQKTEGISPVKLRGLIERATYTQSELAKKIGVTQPMIARLLSGRMGNVKIAFAARLAEALKCSLDDLLEKGS